MRINVGLDRDADYTSVGLDRDADNTSVGLDRFYCTRFQKILFSGFRGIWMTKCLINIFNFC